MTLFSRTKHRSTWLPRTVQNAVSKNAWKVIFLKFPKIKFHSCENNCTVREHYGLFIAECKRCGSILGAAYIDPEDDSYKIIVYREGQHTELPEEAQKYINERTEQK